MFALSEDENDLGDNGSNQAHQENNGLISLPELGPDFGSTAEQTEQPQVNLLLHPRSARFNNLLIRTHARTLI